MNKDNIDLEELEKNIEDGEQIYLQALKKKFVYGFLIICSVILMLKIPKSFWLIPSNFTNEKLDAYSEPVMDMIPENIKATDLKNRNDYIKLQQIKSLKNREKYYILPLAKYSITARIKAKNKFFFNQSVFDKIALVDYGLVFGDMAKPEYFPKIYSYSREQLTGARELLTAFDKKYYYQLKDKNTYLHHHASHTHVIPANRRVMSALNAAQCGQTIKLEGYLVDVYDKYYKRFAMSSLSLKDSNESSRGHNKGGGSCEVMYVNKVQIGRKVFK